MANALYTKGKQSLLSAALNSANLKVVLVDSADYTLVIGTDASLADIPAGARIATSSNLSGKTFTNGTFDADDPTFSGVTGDQFEYVVLYVDTGVEATSYLLAIWDTATGLAFTPSGSDLTLNWNASGIFTW